MNDTRWQYKVETVKMSIWASKIEKMDAQIQDRLTRLGLEGWELVSVTQVSMSQRLYLKRRV